MEQPFKKNKGADEDSMLRMLIDTHSSFSQNKLQILLDNADNIDLSNTKEFTELIDLLYDLTKTHNRKYLHFEKDIRNKVLKYNEKEEENIVVDLNNLFLVLNRLQKDNICDADLYPLIHDRINIFVNPHFLNPNKSKFIMELKNLYDHNSSYIHYLNYLFKNSFFNFKKQYYNIVTK